MWAYVGMFYEPASWKSILARAREGLKHAHNAHNAHMGRWRAHDPCRKGIPGGRSSSAGLRGAELANGRLAFAKQSNTVSTPILSLHAG